MDKAEILDLLRSRGTYVSGQEICNTFGVSRTAVWKAVEQLKKEGHAIEAVRNRGYLLTEETGDVYGREELLSRLETDRIGREVEYYDSIDSTNRRAKQLAEDAAEGGHDGALIFADRQTAGRGRRGRSWESPAGKNIYFSLLLRPQMAPEQAPMLTLLMALAVVRGLRALGAELGISVDDPQLQPRIKWPNDIVLGDRKICGMLTEMGAEQGYIHYVVIGVGINVKKQDFVGELSTKATDIETKWDVQVPRCRLIAHILKAFEELYEAACKVGDLRGLREEFDCCMVNLGHSVRVLDPAGEYDGIARGINDKGELLVEREDGSTTAVYAGEVSVRGIYGYV